MRFVNCLVASEKASLLWDAHVDVQRQQPCIAMYSLRSSWAVCEPITSILSQIRISSTGYIPNIPQYSPRFVGQIQFIPHLPGEGC